MKLFRKAWKDMPDGRANMLSNMDNEAVWQLPEIFDNARDAVIPQVGKTSISPWESVDQIYSYMGNGKVTGGRHPADRDGEPAEQARRPGPRRRRRPGPLPRVVRRPGAPGGDPGPEGKVDEAKTELTPSWRPRRTSHRPPGWSSARSWTDQGPRRRRASALRGAIGDEEDNGLDFEYGPGKRLVALYHQAGQDGRARDLLLKASPQAPEPELFPATRGMPSTGRSRPGSATARR